MKRKLLYKNQEEFSQAFKKNNNDITNLMVEGITEAFNNKKKSAQLFTIGFEDEDEYTFEVTLPSTQWVIALEQCLKNYESWDMSDEIIDTYLLIKKVKEWLTIK